MKRKMITQTIIVWFRQDLRVHDNPALTAAVRTKSAIIPVFIWAPEEEGTWPPGEASKWWIHKSLNSLDVSLKNRGSKLIVQKGPSLKSLRGLVRDTNACGVYWNRRYEPAAVDRDQKIKKALKKSGLHVQSFNSSLLIEPWQIKNQSGKPFRVFTPFWRTVLNHYDHQEPLPAPNKLRTPLEWPKSLSISELDLEPTVNWTEGIRNTWSPGEGGAQDKLNVFLENALARYHSDRNRPDKVGTSRLSPHLHFGEISPREIWHAVRNSVDAGQRSEFLFGGNQYLSEIGWREFAYYLLYHFPFTTDNPLRLEFEKFPWERDGQKLKAWQKGRTGFPIVDAGMRELWTTGWMHNRIRMVVASFLVKDCLVPWPKGAKWFWDTLVDADLANNTLGWQWTAGCGADAAPYFRIFNPVLQGEKFDPSGVYIRRWIPELKDLPNRFIHKPWQAPIDTLQKANVSLGEIYPLPLVDHQEARNRALLAYDMIKKKSEDESVY